jgi:hypothetical protein
VLLTFPVPIILFGLLVFVLLALAGVVLLFPCFALPGRHCAPAGAAVGGQSKCVGDQLFGPFSFSRSPSCSRFGWAQRFDLP